jgi:predicted Zn finger-like uncharacterized protein
MFTRCPECRTVFHITAAELRAADGTVICGACGVTFDALDTLTETRPAGAPEDEATGDEGTGDAEEEDAPEPADEARDEEAFLQELESLIGSEEGEEGIDEADVPREHPPLSPEAPEAGRDEAEQEPVPTAAFAGSSGDEDYDLPDPDSVFRVDEMPEEFMPESTEHFVSDDEDERNSPEASRLGTLEEGDSEARDSNDKEPSVPEDETFPGLDDEERRRPWARLALALVAVIFLAGTWAHAQRGTLLRHPVGAAILSPVYSLLGIEAEPEWRPADFRALRWEAVADPERPERLVVAVEFTNSASFAQPYPLIRVVLEDRFGRRIGRHDFMPDQYLDDHDRGRRLPAGGRVMTTVEVPDPNARADGFRVDFCLEGSDGALVCGPELFR